MTVNKKRRMLIAFNVLVALSEYPSAAKVSRGMGRKTKTLNGPEARFRRELMASRGIRIKRNGGTMPVGNRSRADWWNE